MVSCISLSSTLICCIVELKRFPPTTDINEGFKRFVEIGRVALVNYGQDYGKLVVIVDVVDQNRALVDAPNMERIQMNLKRLSLTDIVIDINRVPKKKNLIEATDKAGLGSQVEDIWAKENCQGNSWRGADESENGGTTRGFHIGGYF